MLNNLSGTYDLTWYDLFGTKKIWSGTLSTISALLCHKVE